MHEKEMQKEKAVALINRALESYRFDLEQEVCPACLGPLISTIRSVPVYGSVIALVEDAGAGGSTLDELFFDSPRARQVAESVLGKVVQKLADEGRVSLRWDADRRKQIIMSPVAAALADLESDEAAA